MIEDWIDTLCDVWAISVDQFTTVKSFKLLQDADFPASIDPSELDKNPIALTRPSAVRPLYSVGWKQLTWYGVTEFHVAPDVDRARISALLRWYGLIIKAAALKVQLSGTTAEIAHFVILDKPNGIEGPLGLTYGNEAEHWGFLVRWEVQESLAGSALPVSG